MEIKCFIKIERNVNVKVIQVLKIEHHSFTLEALDMTQKPVSLFLCHLDCLNYFVRIPHLN